MPQNKNTSASPSGERRNLGFVQLRRGLKEHLHRSRMSSNASTLFVWLLLSARHSGPTRGYVEANYDDLMRGLGWSYSMVRRTIDELASKKCISVAPAANQHEVTVIRIVKFDLDEGDSAVLTSEHPNNSAVPSGVLNAVPTSEQSSEHSRLSNSQNEQDLRGPKKVIEVEKGIRDVRRPDARPPLPFKSKGEKPTLESRLMARIEGLTFKDVVDYCRKEKKPLPWDGREAFNFIEYNADLDNPLLSGDFMFALEEVYDEVIEEEISPANFCSRVMDRCERYRAEYPKARFYWPPDFQAHRDRLREEEEDYLLRRIRIYRPPETDEVARVARPRGVPEELMR